MRKKNVKLEIDLDKTTPRVLCVDSKDCPPGGKGHPEVWKTKNVTWSGKDTTRLWTVTFLGKNTPFEKGRRIFTSDDPTGKLEHGKDSDTFDYCVSYQGPDQSGRPGKMYHSDPKIVLRDGGMDGRDVLSTYFEAAAELHEAIAAAQAELAELAQHATEAMHETGARAPEGGPDAAP